MNGRLQPAISDNGCQGAVAARRRFDQIAVSRGDVRQGAAGAVFKFNPFSHTHLLLHLAHFLLIW